ncbi:TetR/AcrR family transcriptional regulator [Paraburkholderia sp. DHOC27]|uniref:TetR/AcrR family transcriptional regulator n=1 Tax=Paraburkholderia sp. DHOC27 TaxID=2303330 RepID=UPI000E3CE937|nr:TetR/AcrR family transcriptional regulator [Paraburkholderia sp. DHOC27]RFU49177.1 TetR/AcrR family transcriptional regulator [Paraburkholderia sp. DHOC27]
MGYSQADKAETHQRIVDVASRRFRELGLEGISVADVMNEAGLTVGGFYKHFASRDDLVVEAVAAASEQMDHSAFTAQNTLKKSIQTYLSEAHRDEVDTGCPLALLVNDIARTTDEAREAYTQRLEKSLSLLESQMPKGTEGNLRAKALLIYSAYIGAIGLSRAVPDPKLSRQILNAVSAELIALFPAKKPQTAAA